MEAGGSGVIFGRNVWQREWSEALEIIEPDQGDAARQRAPHPLSVRPGAQADRVGEAAHPFRLGRGWGA